MYDVKSMSCVNILPGPVDNVLCLDTCIHSSGRELIVTGSNNNNNNVSCHISLFLTSLFKVLTNFFCFT